MAFNFPPNTGRRRALSISPSSLSNSSTPVLTLSPPLYSTGNLTVTHSSPYTTLLPRRDTLNPFKNLYLA